MILDGGGSGTLETLTGKNTPKVRADASVEEMLSMMDVANGLRAQKKAVEKQLSHEEQVLDLKNRLRATYQAMGTEVDDATLEQAIQSHSSNKYAFQQPPRDFSYKLAEMYVDRGRIGRRYGIPTAILTTLSLAIWGVVEVGKAVHLAAQESAVETAIEKAYGKQQRLLGEVKQLSDSTLAEQLPALEKGELSSFISSASGTLEKNVPFFVEYAPKGSAEEGVTTENYSIVERKLKPIAEALETTVESVENGKKILFEQQEYVDIRRSLETTIASLRESHPPAPLAEKAERTYQSGVKSIEQRRLAEAENSKKELGEMRGIVRDFTNLPQTAEKLYGDIKSIAKEPEALQQGEKSYATVTEAVQALDAGKLRQGVEQLQQLDTMLNQEYKLVIVSHPGVKSGIDRYYKDENGRRASGHYLIVEAVDSHGQVLPQVITNEENNRTEKVKMWGERVPQQAYEKVKRDKKDDGIIQNNEVGAKKKGYLHPEYNSSFAPAGKQITHW